MTYRLLALARSDLMEIGTYIARENPRAADRFLDAVDAKCGLLGRYPQLGRARPEILPRLRSFPIDNYLIFYRESHDGIDVVRIVHGRRRLQNLFGEP